MKKTNGTATASSTRHSWNLTITEKDLVHINVPISEPFFKLPVTELPEARVITRYQGLNVYDKDYQPLIDRLNRYQRRMVIVGQMNLIYLFEKKYTKMLYKHFAWFTENISNQTIPGMPIRNIEPLLCSMDFEAQQKMRPELLITYGGHIISKRLKKFLRRHPPVEHWHVATDGQVADLFGSLTTVIEMDPFEFLEKIAPMMDSRTPEYPRTWEALSKNIPQAVFPYSEMRAIGKVINHLPTPCSLHLANRLHCALRPVVPSAKRRGGVIQPGNQWHRRFFIYCHRLCYGVRQVSISSSSAT